MDDGSAQAVADARRRARQGRVRRRQVRRRRLVAAACLAALVAAGMAVAGALTGGHRATLPRARRHRPPVAHTAASGGTTGTGETTTAGSTAPPPDRSFTVTAVGDIMLGNTPTLPPDPGSYLAAVEPELTAGARIVFGNLEGTLTDATASKCGKPNGGSCFAYRDPPAYADILRRAGFTVLNDANNHSYDFGPAGQAQTVAALHAAGIAQTGLPGEVTVVHAGGVPVAFVAFAPYSDTANLLDLPAARLLIERARRAAPVVVVYMHAGAEGADAQHVTGAEETYAGEDRGNPEAFAHMAVDAGAALVLASGPHVLRGVEFYRHRLIAYSLGNFAGYTNFALGGPLSSSCILRVTLRSDGAFVRARILPIELVDQGRPVSGGDALALVGQLSREDFGTHAARITTTGAVLPP